MSSLQWNCSAVSFVIGKEQWHLALISVAKAAFIKREIFNLEDSYKKSNGSSIIIINRIMWSTKIAHTNNIWVMLKMCGKIIIHTMHM